MAGEVKDKEKHDWPDITCCKFDGHELTDGSRLPSADWDALLAELSTDEKEYGIILRLDACQVKEISSQVAPRELLNSTWLVKQGDVFLVEAESSWLFYSNGGGLIIRKLQVM